MKRIFIKFAVFLLLGAMINVAVAWGFAYCGPYSLGPREAVTSQDAEWWSRFAPTHFPVNATHITAAKKRGAEFVVMQNIQFDEMKVLTRWRAGMPVLAFEGLLLLDNEVDLATAQGLLPIQLKNPLPFHPLWPGFAINTIFYAAIVCALFAVPGSIKRRRRIKRGLCVRCAYPVGANDKCTECGTALRSR